MSVARASVKVEIITMVSRVEVKEVEFITIPRVVEQKNFFCLNGKLHVKVLFDHIHPVKSKLLIHLILYKSFTL